MHKCHIYVFLDSDKHSREKLKQGKDMGVCLCAHVWSVYVVRLKEERFE